MKEYTDYELQVLSEIEQWKNEKDSLLIKLFDKAGAPVAWVYDKIVPGAAQKTISSAVLGVLEMLFDSAQWTYPDKQIFDIARKQGIEICEYTELAKYDIDKLDIIARSFFNENKITAALEGAGCGLGGLALVAADIPMLFTISFRAIQQVGSSYGFDMQDPAMLPVVLSILNAGSVATSLAKANTLTDMKIAAIALAKNWSYKKVAERTQTGVLLQLLKNRTKDMPKQIANSVTKRKLAQALPVVSMGIGAGFNYWFISNVVRTSYMVFRDMYITRKYENDTDISIDI